MNNTRKLLITTTISIALITIISVAAACGPGAGAGAGAGFSTLGVAITFIGGLFGGFLGVLIANKMNK